MTTRTLWIIILKVFGIYTFTQAYYPLMQLVTILMLFPNNKFGDSYLELLFAIFSVSVIITISLALIFKSEFLVNILKLEKNIKEEKIEINVHRSTILTIVVILFGIYLFTESLPLLLKELFNYFNVENQYNRFKNYPGASFIITQFIKLLIGFIMMSSNRPIVNFIELKRKKINNYNN